VQIAKSHCPSLKRKGGKKKGGKGIEGQPRKIVKFYTSGEKGEREKGGGRRGCFPFPEGEKKGKRGEEKREKKKFRFLFTSQFFRKKKEGR